MLLISWFMSSDETELYWTYVDLWCWYQKTSVYVCCKVKVCYQSVFFFISKGWCLRVFFLLFYLFWYFFHKMGCRLIVGLIIWVCFYILSFLCRVAISIGLPCWGMNSGHLFPNGNHSSGDTRAELVVGVYLVKAQLECRGSPSFNLSTLKLFAHDS